MSSSKEEMRELAALFYSVVVSTVSGNELKSMIEQLIKATKDNHVCYPFIFIFLYYLNKTTLHFDKIYKPVSETQALLLILGQVSLFYTSRFIQFEI